MTKKLQIHYLDTVWANVFNQFAHAVAEYWIRSFFVH